MSIFGATLLKTVDHFVAIWPEIKGLQKRCLVEDDILLDPLHFLTASSGERRLCSVACWRQSELAGLMFATEHYARGIRTGYAIGGDFSGRGLLLCMPEDEEAVLAASVDKVFADGIHSLHLRMVLRSPAKLESSKLAVKELKAIIPSDRMPLAPSYDDFLATLGKHTRRNVRYYTRKSVETGICFEPWIEEDEFRRERERLNEMSLFPADQAHLERDDRSLALHHDSQRMALRGADGKFVALLCGFSRVKRFHLLTQWNDPAFEKLSLSTVLRGYAIEHLIERKHDEVQFMGGTSLSFGRFCPPEQYQSVLLDRRYGLIGVGKRLLASYCDRRARAGKPLSFSIESLCGGFLDDARLVKRTALNPASVAFIRSSQESDEPIVSARSETVGSSK